MLTAADRCFAEMYGIEIPDEGEECLSDLRALLCGYRRRTARDTTDYGTHLLRRNTDGRTGGKGRSRNEKGASEPLAETGAKVAESTSCPAPLQKATQIFDGTNRRQAIVASVA